MSNTREGRKVGDRASSEVGSLRVLACDACKGRKIKCDRKAPCSSCVTSKIPCRTTKRIPEKKQRVHLSQRHGQDIADVHKKLELLSDTIKTLLPVKQSSPTNPLSRTGVLASPDKSPSTNDLEILYEGDTSFASQSKHIAETLGSAFQNTPKASPNHAQSSAISKIHQLLKEVSSSGTPTSNPPSNFMGSSFELTSVPLIPVDVVLKLLKFAKERPQRFFVEFPLLTVESFTELCRKIYFPTEDYGICLWILVHCGLFYVFYHQDPNWEWEAHLGLTEAEVEEYRNKCSSNAEYAIQKLRLCMEPSLDSIEALIMAGSMYMDLAKPPAAWMLISAACRMCLDTGLHRQPVDTNSAQARKGRVLFWAPNIQTYDISVEYLRVPGDVEGPWAEFCISWIQFSEFQADILEQLFSARSQKESQDERTKRALGLAERLDSLTSAFTNIPDTSDPVALMIMKDAYMTADIIGHSLRTLIYKCIPPVQPAHPLQFCDPCVSSARAALRALVDAWEKVKHQGDYTWRMFVNWSLIFVPFVPYIVVFGNIIAQNDREDLALLEKTVEVMNGAPRNSKVVHAIERTRIACERFYLIAQAYFNYQMNHGDAAEAPAPRLNQTDRSMGTNPNMQSANSAVQFPSGVGVLDSGSDFSWDDMFNEWDLGLGTESAREIGSFVGQYMGSL